jgi:hypothetical protein
MIRTPTARIDVRPAIAPNTGVLVAALLTPSAGTTVEIEPGRGLRR